MKVNHRFMSSEALVRSYHVAYSVGNMALVKDIESILKERNEADKIPVRPEKRYVTKPTWKIEELPDEDTWAEYDKNK